MAERYVTGGFFLCGRSELDRNRHPSQVSLVLRKSERPPHYY